MIYRPPLRDELLDAYRSMPLLDGSFVVSLLYCPPSKVAAYESQWREWLKTHDRRLWPEWVDQWAQRKKMQAR